MGIPVRLGGRVADDVQVFRAFAEKSYRNRKRNVVRNFAFLLREDEVNDGLSVGLAPEAAVRYLHSNEGFCRISVGDIHSLPFGLEVKLDLDDNEHALICNLPLKGLSDESTGNAIFIANRLADMAIVMTCDPFLPE